MRQTHDEPRPAVLMPGTTAANAGAFQIGLGAATGFALVCPDALLVVLTGFTVASGLPTLSHYIDRHIRGHGSDVPVLGLITLVGLYAIYARIQGRKA